VEDAGTMVDPAAADYAPRRMVGIRLHTTRPVTIESALRVLSERRQIKLSCAGLPRAGRRMSWRKAVQSAWVCAATMLAKRGASNNRVKGVAASPLWSQVKHQMTRMTHRVRAPHPRPALSKGTASARSARVRGGSVAEHGLWLE